MSGPTSPPGKISPVNAPPCSSKMSLRLQTTLGEGEIKGGAVNCPDTPEHTSSCQTSNRDVEGSRGEPVMPKGRTKATAPTLHASVAKGATAQWQRQGVGEMLTI